MKDEALEQAAADALAALPAKEWVARCLFGAPTRFFYENGRMRPVNPGEPGYEEAPYQAGLLDEPPK